MAEVMNAVLEEVRPGISIKELDAKAREAIGSVGARPSFLNYKPQFAATKFPSALCACLNEEIVHGLGNRDKKAQKGDILSIDIGLEYKGLFSDMAMTVPVGPVSKEDRALIMTAKQALEAGMEAIAPGTSLAEVGRRIQKTAESAGFSVIRDLVGHAVGHGVHEEPSIPNYYDPNLKDSLLEEGMVLALEPMVAAGSPDIDTLDDGWTVVTLDGSRAAHFEHTVAVTSQGFEILTA